MKETIYVIKLLPYGNKMVYTGTYAKLLDIASYYLPERPIEVNEWFPEEGMIADITEEVYLSLYKHIFYIADSQGNIQDCFLDTFNAACKKYLRYINKNEMRLLQRDDTSISMIDRSQEARRFYHENYANTQAI